MLGMYEFTLELNCFFWFWGCGWFQRPWCNYGGRRG